MSRPVTNLVFATASASAFGMAAGGQMPERMPLLRDISPETITIAVYYKENVHDPADQKIGRIVDLVIKPDDAVSAAIVSVGGFLGLASKYVAVPFAALQVTQKERKPYTTMEMTPIARFLVVLGLAILLVGCCGPISTGSGWAGCPATSSSSGTM